MRTPDERGFEAMIVAGVLLAFLFGGIALGAFLEKQSGQDWPIQLGWAILIVSLSFIAVGVSISSHFEELKKEKKGDA